jgi:hypothetical protein
MELIAGSFASNAPRHKHMDHDRVRGRRAIELDVGSRGAEAYALAKHESAALGTWNAAEKRF